MLLNNQPKEEVHKRIPKDEVDVTQYEPLIHKIIKDFARTYGDLITDNYEDYVSVGYIALMKAKKAYDPDRGTFVTIAFRKVLSAVHALYLKYKKQQSVSDLRKLKVSDKEGESAEDSDSFTENVSGSNIDYGVVGSMLSEECQRLYLALCKGERKGAICRHLDIKWHDYDKRVRELKDELHEVMTILYGEQV